MVARVATRERTSAGLSGVLGGSRGQVLGDPVRRRRRRRTRLIALLVTAIVLITVDFRGPGGIIGVARDATLDALAPLRSGAAWLLSPVANAWEGLTRYDDVSDENDRLRQQLEATDSQSRRVVELEAELRELRSLTGMNVQSTIERVGVRLTETRISNFERTFEVDKGSSDGIEEGMPVVTGAGLVGKVVQVSRTTARVEPLTNAGFAVGVRLVSSGDQGVAEARGSGLPLVIDLIELDTPVIPGETVLTSGLQDSLYPEGLVVGTVSGVEAQPVEGRQLVKVDPAVDLDRVRFAEVLLFRPGDQAEVGTVPVPGLDRPPVTTVDGDQATEPDGQE